LLRVFHEKGICIEKNSFKIDPDSSRGASSLVITHAHSDHVKFNKNTDVYCSPETLSLIEANYREVRKPHAIEFGKKNKFDSFEFSLHNSGHILGSAQVLVEGQDRVVGVTSDFKLQDSLIMKKAEPLDCDTLIMECTFGLPEFSFPEREIVYNDMEQWCKSEIKQGKKIVLAGYSIGKAQELTAFSNKFLGINPIVHGKIFKNNTVYEEHGVKLGKFIEMDHNLGESDVLILPPSYCSPNLLQALEYSTKNDISAAIATGWNYGSYFNKVFNLSDHGSYNQLIEYVEQANPKHVLTTHGYSSEFARTIKRKLRIPAKPLHETGKGQSNLVEFD